MVQNCLDVENGFLRRSFLFYTIERTISSTCKDNHVIIIDII